LTKSKTVTCRLTSPDFEELSGHARQRSASPAQLGATLLARQIRALSHPAIELDLSPVGHAVARLRGRRVAVWVVCQDLTALHGDTRRAARQLDLPEPLVQAARRYAAAFPEEIEQDAALGRRRVHEDLLSEAK